MKKLTKKDLNTTFDSAASCTDKMIKIQGPSSSGKTEILVRRCANLVLAGTNAYDILVSMPTDFAAADFKARLCSAFAKRDLKGAEDIYVSSVRDICTHILETQQARTSLSRVPRILNDAEYKFFLEDMRTLGQPARRMRGMLSFFYKQWALCSKESDWMIGSEEKAVYDYAQEVLASRGAMLSQEVAYLCAQFLTSDAGAHFTKKYSHVLIDDFQNLSKAEQTCMCLLAQKQLIVCGNTNEAIERKNTYTYALGFSQFEELRHGVKVITLNSTCTHEEIACFGASLCTAKSMDENLAPLSFCANDEDDPSKTPDHTPESDNTPKTNNMPEAASAPENECFCEGAHIIKWLTPEHELDGLTKFLRSLADADASVSGSNTCIIVPNKQWVRMIERVLDQRGFKSSQAGCATGLGGDVRESAKCKALVAYTMLNLIANSHDMSAWRSWCGFDNYLTNSDAWAGLQEFAQNNNISLEDALNQSLECKNAGEAEPFLRAYVLADRWEAGHELIEKHKKRRGFALLRALGAQGLREFEELERALAGDESAEEVFELAKNCINHPAFPEQKNCIHVSTYENMSGLKYDNIFIFSCIDGFMPARDAFEMVSTDEDRQNIMDNERRAFYRAVASAKKRLVVSYFTKAQLEVAERAKMQVARIRSEGNERMALVRPSVFLSETESARPSTMGGQALLAAIGLD